LSRRQKIVWLIIGLLFFVGFFSLVPAHYQACEINKYTEHEHCTTYQLVPFVYIEIKDILDDLGSVITALATIAIAWFTWTLKRSTDNLWDVTRKGEERQQKDTRILQRAYISVEPGGVHKFRDGTDRFSCEIIMRNAGNLPARNISWFISRKISDKEDEVIFPPDTLLGKIVLAPKVLTRSGSLFLSGDEIREKNSQWADKQYWIYVWGRVQYHDGFVEGRSIDFCHRYNIAAANDVGEIDEETARFHEEYNRTDER
jgi:hypothetical protein